MRATMRAGERNDVGLYIYMYIFLEVSTSESSIIGGREGSVVGGSAEGKGRRMWPAVLPPVS